MHSPLCVEVGHQGFQGKNVPNGSPPTAILFSTHTAAPVAMAVARIMMLCWGPTLPALARSGGVRTPGLSLYTQAVKVRHSDHWANSHAAIASRSSFFAGDMVLHDD
jgi:hypothetical protein